MNHLTTDQKREFLVILLSKGKATAENYLAESLPPDYWFTSLQFEMQLAIIRFRNANKPISDLDFNQSMNRCLSCCSGNDFELCLDEETKRIKNEAHADI